MGVPVIRVDGMYMDVQWSFEEVQSRFNHPARFVDPLLPNIGPSGWSEEDLPSDWIGYWLGSFGSFRNPNYSGDLWTTLDADTGCGVLNQDRSIEMYNYYQANGGFLLGWGEWTRRPRPPSLAEAECNRMPPGIARDECLRRVPSLPCTVETWPPILATTHFPKLSLVLSLNTAARLSTLLGWADVTISASSGQSLVQTGINGFTNSYSVDDSSHGTRVQVFGISKTATC